MSPTTLREYRRLVDKRIAPGLGKTPLVKLTTPVLDEFYRALSDEAGLAPSSVRQVHSIIR
ncbi:MAG: site-specific integrase, partial [Actinomycetia bacterium]|nr:site-specific integrase [Actinomycetes bacterium]